MYTSYPFFLLKICPGKGFLGSVARFSFLNEKTKEKYIRFGVEWVDGEIPEKNELFREE